MVENQEPNQELLERLRGLSLPNPPELTLEFRATLFTWAKEQAEEYKKSAGAIHEDGDEPIDEGVSLFMIGFILGIYFGREHSDRIETEPDFYCSVCLEKIPCNCDWQGPCTDDNPCCERRGEYNGFHTGPTTFRCPNNCSCHD